MSRKNYTEQEKRELLALVEKYKTIIENKSTNGVFIEQKNQTWQEISEQFNGGSEFPRTAKQLSTAYSNLKRLTRQKVAQDNNKKYIDNKQKEDLKKIKKDYTQDKKAVMATGGGQFKPVLSDVGAQMLALMGDQIKPLPNSCDSATDYYRIGNIHSDEENNNGDDESVVIVKIIDDPQQHILDDHEEVIEEPAPSPKDPAKRRVMKTIKHKHSSQNKKKNAEAIKTDYYNKKLQCAIIEKKTNIMNYKIAFNKNKLVNLKIKIQEAQLEDLTSKI